MSVDDRLAGHVLLECDGRTCRDSSGHCMWCDGGLSACTRCGAFEGAWPDACPGEQMTGEQSDAVYAGTLNYHDGRWVDGECCEVMRPVHDAVAYMAEHGYARDADGPGWHRITPASSAR